MSQFVITYGPSAIIEGYRGPRVILRPDLGLFSQSTGLNPSDYGITDQRMTRGLLGSNAAIFRLPSNAELNLPSNRYVYRTRVFPDWRLCVNDHQGNFNVLYEGTKGNACPVCQDPARQTQEPIRFIVACARGHMDDINWYSLVHRYPTDCSQTTWFRWSGGGGALNDIRIECPRTACRQHYTMGQAFGEPWPCSGRQPENELPRAPPSRIRGRSDHTARIIQRQASNLRIPVLRTLLTIPPRHTRLHNKLQHPSIYSNLVGSAISSRLQLQTILERLVSRGMVTSNDLQEIISHPWPEIEQAIQDVLADVPSSYSDLILEEFHAFIHGSNSGVPAIYAPRPSSQVIFEINRNFVRSFEFPTERQLTLKIVPVLTMRTVTVQYGYRREVDTDNPASTVPVGFHSSTGEAQTYTWYPGVEYLGEGIFIMLDSQEGWHYDLASSASRWNAAFRESSHYPDQEIFRGQGREELHPLFVWWHTLAHLLIRSISVEAGYSSASIRERIYLEINSSRARGGILLYATRPGSEGSLGGMLSLVPYFDEILDVSFDMLRYCSGDPLCAESHFEVGKYNGSACYGCLLISETSCEHRNMWLDRNLLRENIP